LDPTGPSPQGTTNQTEDDIDRVNVETRQTDASQTQQSPYPLYAFHQTSKYGLGICYRAPSRPHLVILPKTLA
jgi:hypothetical protein